MQTALVTKISDSPDQTTRDAQALRGEMPISSHSLYSIWGGMRGRCHNSRTRSYVRYGARGIKVCERWLRSFAAFVEDMGPRPTPKHSIDRINNDGNYEPGNCRWANGHEQARNRSDSRSIRGFGRTRTLPEWAQEMRIPVDALQYRLGNGLSLEASLGGDSPLVPDLVDGCIPFVPGRFSTCDECGAQLFTPPEHTPKCPACEAVS